jgi:hypothetical protein
MNTSSPADTPIQAMRSATNLNGSAFWERLWRLSGINFIACFVIAYVHALRRA